MSATGREPESFREIAQQAAVTFGFEKDYEFEQLAHLRNSLQTADRFLDIGANHGLYAYLANRVLRNGSIALVEANPALAETLRAAIKTWPDNGNRIEVFSVAASDAPATLPFFIEDADALGTLVRKSDSTGNSVIVRCEPLDNLFRPDGRTLIKIDVEGFEYRVVSGARRLLSTGAHVFIELHGWGDPERGKYPFHVIWLMNRLGFAISRIGDSYTYDFVRTGPLMRIYSFLRWGSVFFMKYVIRRSGLRPFVYRVFWPHHPARA